MAESAGFHVGRMMPELEQIRSLNLFTAMELTEIVNRRQEFEHKIERAKNAKQEYIDDYLAYINYEVKLINRINLQRDRFGIYDKKGEIEYALTKRVIKLYKKALTDFKSDVKLWMSYINFCTQTKFVNVASNAFKQMLQVHGDKIHLWKYAARWELEELNNIDGALNVLKQGINQHPASKELYTEAFKLELESVSQENKNNNNVNEDQNNSEKSVSRADDMFRASVTSIGHDVEYIITLLEIASSYDFTKILQRNIAECLIHNCWKSELMWQTMALRELNGLHYDENKGNESRIQLCIAVYRSGTQVVPTSLMWEKYLDTLLNIYRDKNKKTSIKDILLKAFQDGYKAKFLLEKHFKVWVEIEESQKQLDILVMATSCFPSSVDLWISRLQQYICLEQEEQLYSVSKEAINILKEKSLPVYKILIEYKSLKLNNFLEMKATFEEGISREAEISSELKPMYIEWLCIAKNIKVARQEYDKIAKNPPYCLQLHKKMVQLEMGRLGSVSMNAIRNVHKLACQQFGKYRIDVWLDYVKFEMTACPRLVSDIYNNAKNTLKNNLVPTFMSQYALLHAYSE